jgi:hypothetical protein
MQPDGSFAPHSLNQWDENHNRKNVDRPSVQAQSEYKTLQQENHAYTGYDYHNEDVGCNESV